MPADRNSALRYLKAVADEMKPSFFSIHGRTETLPCDWEGVKLRVVKHSYSQAKPANISYQVFLGDLLPRGRDGREGSLMAYALYPKDDRSQPEDPDAIIAVNRAAYKRCLEKLVNNPDSFTAESTVR